MSELPFELFFLGFFGWVILIIVLSVGFAELVDFFQERAKKSRPKKRSHHKKKQPPGKKVSK